MGFKNSKKVLFMVLTNRMQFVWAIVRVEVVSRSSVISDIMSAFSVPHTAINIQSDIILKLCPGCGLDSGTIQSQAHTHTHTHTHTRRYRQFTKAVQRAHTTPV